MPTGIDEHDEREEKEEKAGRQTDALFFFFLCSIYFFFLSLFCLVVDGFFLYNRCLILLHFFAVYDDIICNHHLSLSLSLPTDRWVCLVMSISVIDKRTHTLDRSLRLFSRPIVTGVKEKENGKYMNDKIGEERLLIISITMIVRTNQH